MIDNNALNLNQLMGLIGTIFGLISLIYAFYQTRTFSKGIKMTSLLHIRSLINRMEEEKGEHEKNSAQWKAMHDTQQELETLFKGQTKLVTFIGLQTLSVGIKSIFLI